MTDATCAAAAARHLRLHRDLLALRRHTLVAPCLRRTPSDASPGERDAPDTSAAFLAWLAQRQRLVDRVRAHDAPGLADRTTALVEASPDHSAAALLRLLCDKERDLMQSLAEQERAIAAAMRHELEWMRTRLVAASRVTAARRRYAALGR